MLGEAAERPKKTYQCVLAQPRLEHYLRDQVALGSEASVNVTTPQHSCKGLSTITWLPESNPGICHALIKHFYGLMVMQFYCLIRIHRELPISQGFKPQITSMNNPVLPTSPSPLWFLQLLELGWMWQEAQLLALIQACHWLCNKLHCCLAHGAQCIADELWAG